ncbi:AsnC family transcriptional regulator [Streptomyces graminofaciens]|uniref:AsnC family transcriptional regulator n=2 Tax=Streptomyces graminofaciens TaxID=68212 RepID=A0ABN5W031_9ACTN|nr:AsnC family transcriptional regulator [Streptomyces graminofaciens]
MIDFLKGRSTAWALLCRGFPCNLSGMTVNSPPTAATPAHTPSHTPDATDWRILEVLQREGRASFAELARAVSMSASAVTERVRRLEEAGVIQGYAAVVDPERLGLPILAFVRLRYPNGNYRPFHDLVAVTPEILEAHHVTGDDCFVIKVAARSMRHLEEVSGKIGALGSVTTSVVYSSPLPRRPLGR